MNKGRKCIQENATAPRNNTSTIEHENLKQKESIQH